MTIIYKIENFQFQYPNTDTSISIDGCLTIHHGDIILLQGNSGSGKSTLLLALKGIIPHLINGKLSGSILFYGQNITTLTTTNQIGYLGQNPHNQLICETVYQELAFGLENMGILPSSINQKIKQYSIKFKVEHLLERQTKTLSGGEKQKINLISILITEPEVLLLDEPTAFLDPQSADEIISIIKEISTNKTIIIIEHNIHYLQHLINRAILINQQGQITQYSPAEIGLLPQLINQPCKFKSNGNSLPLLEINQLNFSYDSKLLNNISLKINSGEVIGITGKNGSGKSTLLKLISKIIPCHKHIYYKQQDIYTLKAAYYWREISLLWQNPENHFLYQSVKHELDNKVAIISEFALDKVMNQNPYCLSEGQKRRLSIAISIKPDNTLFLLDEPTFGQDPENKQMLAQLINNLVLDNKSFIIVSHDIAFLNTLTKNIYYLDKNGLHHGK